MHDDYSPSEWIDMAICSVHAADDAMNDQSEQPGVNRMVAEYFFARATACAAISAALANGALQGRE